MISFLEKSQEFLRADRNLYLRLIILFFLSLMTNALGCIFAFATAHKMTLTVMVIGFFLPIVNFSITLFFLNAKTFSERIYIMLVNALALSLAAGAVSQFYG